MIDAAHKIIKIGPTVLDEARHRPWRPLGQLNDDRTVGGSVAGNSQADVTVGEGGTAQAFGSAVQDKIASWEAPGSTISTADDLDYLGFQAVVFTSEASFASKAAIKQPSASPSSAP
jgi:hypothetical protein